jgi:hypothetical protein
MDDATILRTVAQRLLDVSWDDADEACWGCDGALDATDCPKHGDASGCYGFKHTGQHEDWCPLAPLLDLGPDALR